MVITNEDDEGNLRSVDKIDRDSSWGSVRGVDGDQNSIWTCATGKRNGVNSGNVKDEDPLSYVFNTAFIPWNPVAKPWKVTDAVNPAETVIASDGRMVRNWGTEIILRGNDSVLAENGGYESWRNKPNSFDKDVYFYSPDLDNDDTSIYGAWYGHIRYPHLGGKTTNVNFVDGHVESIKPFGLKKGNFTVTW